MAQQVTCPNCQRKYAVKPEFAGKRAKCKCGAKIQFPAAETDVLTEADLIDDVLTEADLMDEVLTEEDLLEDPASGAPPPSPAAPEGTACRNCLTPLLPGTVICTRCGMNQRSGRIIRTEVVKGLPRARPVRAVTPTVEYEEMSGLDWVLVVFCSGIALIVGIVRVAQGRGSGMTMVIASLVMSAIWTAIRFLAFSTSLTGK